MGDMTCENVSLWREVKDWALETWRPEIKKAAFGLVLTGMVLVRIGHKIGGKL